MPLSKETIIANEALQGLTDEQVSAIEVLSQNSEDELFREKMGDHYRKLDASIEEHSGVARNGAEKTYDYLPRAIDAMKAKYEAEIGLLKTENGNIKSQLDKGGDEATKAQLANVQRELESTKQQYLDMKTSYEEEKKRGEQALNDYKIGLEIEHAKDGLKIKSGLNEMAIKTLVSQAIANIKAKNPSFEEREGNERLVFHDANGVPLNNPENKLNTYTAKELLIKEFMTMGILDTKPAVGGGGKGNEPHLTNVLGAKTQTEASDIITKTLTTKGLTRGSSEFQAEFNKAWMDNNISSLPLK